MSILALSACNFRHDVEVNFPLTMWPGFAIVEGQDGAYYRGAVVANLVTFLVIGLLGVAAAAVRLSRHRPSKRTAAAASAGDGGSVALGLRSAMGWLRYPGVMAAPLGVVLPGTVASSVAAITHGTAGVTDVALGLYGLVSIVGCVALVVAIAVVVPVRYAHPLTIQQRLDNGDDDGRLAILLRRLFVGRGSEWVAKTGDGGRSAALMKMFGPVFQRYRVECRWYFGFDAALTITVAVAQGSLPEGRQQCLVAMGAVLVPCLVAFVAVVLLRPDNAPGKLVLHIVSCGVTLLSAVLAVIGIATESNLLVSLSQASALGASAISAASAALSASLQLYFILNRRNAGTATVTSGSASVEFNAAIESSDVEAAAAAGSSMSTLLDTVERQEKDHRSTATKAAASTVVPTQANSFAGFTLDDDDDAVRPSSGVGLPTTRQKKATPFAIHRTEEGQRRFDELESMLHDNGPKHVTAVSKDRGGVMDDDDSFLDGIVASTAKAEDGLASSSRHYDLL